MIWLLGAALAVVPFMAVAALILRFMPLQGGASTHYGHCRCGRCRRMDRGGKV